MRKQNYISNEELWNELVSAQQTMQPSERLGQLLILMHEHILNHANFSGYSKETKEDMMSYSIFRLLKKGIYTYDTSRKSKAFSYMTMAVFNNFYNYSKRRYKKMNAHQKYVKAQLQKISDAVINQKTRSYIDSFRSSDEQE